MHDKKNTPRCTEQILNHHHPSWQSSHWQAASQVQQIVTTMFTAMIIVRRLLSRDLLSPSAYVLRSRLFTANRGRSWTIFALSKLPPFNSHPHGGRRVHCVGVNQVLTLFCLRPPCACLHSSHKYIVGSQTSRSPGTVVLHVVHQRQSFQ